MLSEQDAIQINKRRTDFGVLVAASDSPPSDGYVAHVGNRVHPGEVFPGIIVRTWGDQPTSAVQLQVFLDGTDTFWATSVSEGAGERHWIWPPRI